MSPNVILDLILGCFSKNESVDLRLHFYVFQPGLVGKFERDHTL